MKPVLSKYAGMYRAPGHVVGDDLGRAYSQSSIVVVPSVEDGWGHVTLEAMSCGLPVIVSANVGSADAVEEGVNGFIVRACDTPALMEKIEFLYRRPDVCQEMRRQSETKAENRTWPVYGREMLDVFASIQSRCR